MTMSDEDAIAVQRAHESRLLALAGVNGVAVKLRDGQRALVVDVSPDAEIPRELRADTLDGLPLIVERNVYRPL